MNKAVDDTGNQNQNDDDDEDDYVRKQSEDDFNELLAQTNQQYQKDEEEIMR